MKLLKKIKCKLFACFGSKCSLNDTDGDGEIDQISYVDDNGIEITQSFKKGSIIKVKKNPYNINGKGKRNY